MWYTLIFEETLTSSRFTFDGVERIVNSNGSLLVRGGEVAKKEGLEWILRKRLILQFVPFNGLRIEDEGAEFLVDKVCWMEQGRAFIVRSRVALPERLARIRIEDKLKKGFEMYKEIIPEPKTAYASKE